MTAAKTLLTASGAVALLFALTASTCDTSTEIIPYVAEICNDKLDNDTDGKTDCQDPDCDAPCEVHVNINPITANVGVDTVDISGTQTNASGIAVTITPNGTSSTPVITGDKWTATLKQIATPNTTYTVTAIAKDAQGRNDTDIVKFDRKN